MKPKKKAILISTLLASASLLTLTIWADALDTWTVQTSGLPTNAIVPGCSNCGVGFFGVAYGDGAFVAVGTPGVGTSYDGVHWATRAVLTPGSTAPNNLSTIIYNGTFMACGTTGATGASMIFTSTNGTNWVEANVPSGTVSQPLPSLSGIAYNGLVYVAVGGEGTVLLSTNGVNWMQNGAGGNGIPATEALEGVVWGNGVFVAIGESTGNAYVSVDGENWIAHPTGFGVDELQNIASMGGLFVAAADSGMSISSSTDGTNWVPAANGNSDVFSGFAVYGMGFGNGQFVVVGGGGLNQPTIISATNSSPLPLTWFSRFAPSDGDGLGSVGYLRSVAYANGLWVAVGSAATSPSIPLVMTAGKLVSIKSETYPGVLKYPITGQVFSTNGFLRFHGLLAVGDNGSIVTFVGATPYLQLCPTTHPLFGVAAALSDFVAVGADGTILSSPDATNWTEVASPTTNALYGVASGDGLDVAVGANGVVLTSVNDSTWTNQTSVGSGSLIGITFGEGNFEALTANGTVLISTNGTNWRSDALVLPTQASHLSSISFADGLFSGTDTNGDVLTSSDGVHWDLLVSGSSATAGINTASLVNGTLFMLGNADTLLTMQFPIASTGTSSDLYSVAFNGTNFVAVGEAGTIIISTDASSWSIPTNYLDAPDTLLGVTYGGGIFVGVGEDGWVVSSPDGENWTSAASGATVNNLNAVAYGGGRFVAVGDSGTIITSVDGVHWTVADSGDTSTLEGIAFANGMFVVSDLSGDSLVSKDGTHWFAGGFSLDSDVLGVAEGNGVWVIADGNGEMYSSTDGSNWVEEVSPQFGLAEVAYGGGMFVAVGTSGQMLVSPNGTNWTQIQTSVTNQYVYGVVFGESQFVVVGTDGTSLSASLGAVASVPPATAWNVVNSPATGSLTSVAVNGQLNVVVSIDSASDVDSTDGMNWTVQGNGLQGANTGVTLGNGIYVTVDQNGGIYTSLDGTNWTSQTSTGVGMSAVAFGGGVYVATASAGEVFSSSDSVHWTAHHTGLTADLSALTYAKGQFVVVATDGTVATSTNGTTWTAQVSPSTVSLYGITYAHGLFVAVGEDGTIMTSYDSSNWTLQTNAPNTVATLDAVAWGNNEFMAVGANGWTLRSGDGTNWIASGSATVNDLNAITFANGRFLALGINGTIIETPAVVRSHLDPISLVPGTGIQITLQGTPNSSYNIEVSTNLVNWSTLTSLSLSGTNAVQFIDSAPVLPNVPHRFYRAVLAP